MTQINHKSFPSPRTDYNLLCIFNKLVIGVLFITFSATTVYAGDNRNPASYKENTKLSELLDNEHFQLGLSCEEAMKSHKLDKKIGQGKRVKLASSLLGFEEDKAITPGFINGSCQNDKIKYVTKIVSSEDVKPESKMSFDAFIKQYGKPSFQRKGGTNIRYYIIHKGIHAELSISRRQINNKTLTIFDLEDNTTKVKK